MRLATLAEWQQLLLPKDKVVESGERLRDFKKRGPKPTIDFCFKYDQKKILVGGKKLALNYFQPGPLKVELGLGSKGQTRKKNSRDPDSRAGFLGSVRKTPTLKTSK